MGISLETWRARIGLFCGVVLCRGSKESVISSDENKIKVPKAYVTYGFVIFVLLVIAGVERNPGPSQKSEMAEIKDILNIVRASNEEIVREVKQMKETINNVMGRFLKIESALEGVTNDVSRLQDCVNYLEYKIDDLENRGRRQNLVLFGIPEDRDENWDSVEEKVRRVISDRLGINLSNQCIQRCHRLGRKYEGKARAVICYFWSFKTKEKILRNKSKLRGTGIYIEEDFSHKVRSERQKLQPYLVEARNRGSFAYLQYKYLYIDGRRFTLSQLEGDLNHEYSGESVNCEGNQSSKPLTEANSSIPEHPTAPNSKERQEDSVAELEQSSSHLTSSTVHSFVPPERTKPSHTDVSPSKTKKKTAGQMSNSLESVSINQDRKTGGGVKKTISAMKSASSPSPSPSNSTVVTRAISSGKSSTHSLRKCS
jgi:hypothetical protein